MRMYRWRIRNYIFRKYKKLPPQTFLAILLFTTSVIFFCGLYSYDRIVDLIEFGVSGTIIVMTDPNKLVALTVTGTNNFSYFQSCMIVSVFMMLSRNKIEYTSWTESMRQLCDGAFVGYAHEFALLHNFTIDPIKSKDNSKGLELKKVVGQKENDEFLQLMPGSFCLKCDRPVTYTFSRGFIKNHLSEWMNTLNSGLNIESCETRHGVTYVSDFTIAIVRYEYANLYHTMTDLYNAFLIMHFFGKQPSETAVLFVDAHPISGLDEVWKTLFGRIIRMQTLQRPMHFTNLVWGMMGYNSPLDDHRSASTPCLDSFSKFFINRHGIQVSTRSLQCSELNVLYLWRRDYVAHARNPSGKVSRKIKNENELLEATAEVFPNFKISSISTETMGMHEQLSWIQKTDILIAMHGAGLSHVLFLPKTSAVIELYPNYWPSSNIHFRAMARWRGLHYRYWVNYDGRNEFENYYTYIPPTEVVNLLKETVKTLCIEKSNE